MVIKSEWLPSIPACKAVDHGPTCILFPISMPWLPMHCPVSYIVKLIQPVCYALPDKQRISFALTKSFC